MWDYKLDDYSFVLEEKSKYFNGLNFNALTCPLSSGYNSTIMDFLAKIEVKYQCAGICIPLNYLTFTNIVLGPP